jgi:hypothetical protein
MTDRVRKMQTTISGTGMELVAYDEPDEHGQQGEAGRVTRDASTVHPRYRSYMLNYAYAHMLSVRTHRGAGVGLLEAEKKMWAQLQSGTWNPETRGGATRVKEPSDFALALAQVFGGDVNAIQKRIDTEYETDEHGEPVLNESGRKERRFTTSKIRLVLERADSAPIREAMARIIAERAKREAAAAKALGKSGAATDEQGPSLGDMFATRHREAAE